MKRTSIHPARIAVIILSAVYAVWICLPGFLNAGTYLGVALGTAGVLCGIFAPGLGGLIRRAWERAPGRAVLCALAALLLGALAFCGYNGVMMARYSHRPLEQVRCIMILGCQVRGDQPGGELEKRLTTALPLINENPEAPVIVTGGQGLGEAISEAECMKRWLVAEGVPEARIYAEDGSHSTAENFRYSSGILQSLGISDGIAVVTNDFHQYRAELYARKFGLSVGHYSSETRLLVLPNYLIRELAALFFVR